MTARRQQSRSATPRRRPGLGRGLDALLPEARPEPTKGGLLQVSVDDVRPNPNQPRRDFDETALAELTASIAGLGILQPLVVRRAGAPDGRDGDYELVAGERRLRAARNAGLAEIPVVVVETDPQGSLERALVENIHRADLNPIEEAAAYRQLIDEGGLTQDSLASRLGRNRVSITNALRLLDLPVPVQELLAQGRLTAGHGKALLGLQHNPFLERMAKRAVQESLSVRETEELVRRYQSMSTDPKSPSAAASGARPAVAEAQRLLAQRLQTRVRVEMGKRKGRIVIDFVSLEELERLLKEMGVADSAPSWG